jgi:small membrane protein
MTKFQVIGILSMLFILVSYFRSIRRPAIAKIIVSLILITGIVFFLYPELTNQLAHYLGIGRGADLIFYLSILGFAYLFILLYSKIRRLETQLASVIRNESLESMRKPEKNAG